MVTYDIYSIQTQLASMETTVRFRVWETRGALLVLKNECEATFEGRYEVDDDELEALVVAAYQQEFTDG
jgi:hypothetical protein